MYKECQAKAIPIFDLSLTDLQEVSRLEARRRLSKGELSSIAFAARTRQAFLSDDQKARKLSEAVLTTSMTQTIPHLFGWLIFKNFLGDADKDVVIEEHSSNDRPLKPHFESAYLEALRCRLMVTPNRPPE